MFKSCFLNITPEMKKEYTKRHIAYISEQTEITNSEIKLSKTDGFLR